MTEDADSPPRPTVTPPRSGSWIPLLGSAAIVALMLTLIIGLSLANG